MSDPAAMFRSDVNAVLLSCTLQLRKVDRNDLAAKIAAHIVAESDNSADAHSLLADTLDQLGQWPDALAHWQRAADLAPQSPVAAFNLALALLRLGEHERGSRLYEARIDKPDWTGFSALPSRAAARERVLKPGDPVAGRTIVVLAEQGLGDCIMFARYVPRLAARGARVLLACSPDLYPIFAQVPGIDQLLAPPADQPLAKLNLSALDFDAWVPLLSLPLHIEPGRFELVADGPYFQPEPARVAEWRERYEARGTVGAPKIGLVWQSNLAGRAPADRSLRAADLAPLLALEGIDWIALQPGDAAREMAAAHPRVIDPPLSCAGLDEFAAALAATDLLVTVDTMAAHLAGAIGHQAWLTVPFNPHWYWRTTGTTTPWYPTLRLFRQTTRGDWLPTMQDIAEQLRISYER
jgi:ADP-heptose:LPS heptosyltransferase